jgi:hypothetical protein
MNALVKPARLGVPFGVLMAYLYSLDNSASESILVGLACAGGITFGFAGYSVWKQRSFNAWADKQCVPFAAEGIVHRGYATLGGREMAVLGAVAVAGMVGAALATNSGMLVLTKQQLAFVPFRTNLFGKQSRVALTDIIGVRPAPYFGASTITVHTSARQAVDIKVRTRDEWLAKLAATGVNVTRAGVVAS